MHFVFITHGYAHINLIHNSAFFNSLYNDNISIPLSLSSPPPPLPQVLDPDLDLRTVRYRFWKSGGDMKLFYREVEPETSPKEEEEKEKAKKEEEEEEEEGRKEDQEGMKEGKEQADSSTKGNEG